MPSEPVRDDPVRDADRDPHRLLADAAAYARDAARPAHPGLLGHPTPCHGWDLRMLLRHLNDSLAALLEAYGTTGRVALAGAPEEPADLADPAVPLRLRATALRTAALRAAAPRCGPPADVRIGGLPLPPAELARAGALELAVHGWDVTQATGEGGGLPAALAVPLLAQTLHLVPPPALRPPLFGPPRPVPDDADPATRLLAHLGRTPALLPT